MGYALRSSERYSYADYLTWPDDARYELIDGHAYLMAPAPSYDHQVMAFEIAHQVRAALEGNHCSVLVAPVDVRLPKAGQADDTVDTVVQPDVLVVCDPAKIEARGVKGPPDWVVEVLSPASASHDQTIKLKAYERAGVREYWLVHPGDRLVIVYRLAEGAYGRPDIQALEGETAIGALPGVAVRWEPIVRRMLPQAL
ncbi:MAG: Uma2 family endonuclease [Methylococcaceae bacterium]|nr:Uma2 family endonuclease [Methylococcaceae bacterium]